MAYKDTILDKLQSLGFEVDPSETSQIRILISGVGECMDEMNASVNEDSDKLYKISLDKKVGTLSWYAEICKEFQYGYNMELDDRNIPFYPTIDDSAKIVKYAASTENGQVVTVKVAKDSSGEPEPLSTDELNDLVSYLRNLKMAGTYVNVVSINNDTILYNIRVRQDGRYSVADLTANIETAMDNYRKNLPFDGVFSLSEFLAEVTSVDGVSSIDMTTINSDVVWSNDYNQTAPVADTVILTSGHFQYDSNSTIDVI